MESDFVKELVWSLKPEFLDKKFSEVEKVLKDKFFQEIEDKKKEIDLLKAKFELDRFDKLQAEREIEKLTKERNELNKKLNELNKKWNDDKNVIVELQKKNGNLECEKVRAERDLDVFRKRFEELEARVERLQVEWDSMNAADEQMGVMDSRVSEERNHLQENVMPEVKTGVDANGENHLENLELGDNSGKKKSSGNVEVEGGANCLKNNEISAEKMDQIGSSNNDTSMDNAGTEEKKVMQVDVGGKKKSSGSEEVESGANCRKNNEISAEKVVLIGSSNVNTSKDNAEEKKVIEVDVGGGNKRIVTNDSEPNEGTASCTTVDKKGGTTSRRTVDKKGGTTSRRMVDKKGGIGRPSTEIINIDSDDDSSSPKSTNVQEMAEKLLKRKRLPAGPALLNENYSSSSSESDNRL